ncbi:pancreatic triacylglycerol lipase-like, partial [Mantella aurantiaca]
MSVRLILLLSIAATFTASDECNPRLGCFPMDYPYSDPLTRPLIQEPASPEDVNVHYFLFTRENADQFQMISALDVSTVTGTNFKPSRKSYFIAHGHGEKGDKEWLVTMCKNLLKVSDVNCFCVDWSAGASGLYTKTASNVRVAGSEIAYFLGFLQEKYGYKMSQVTLIGHSLGSHVVGEAGKKRPGIEKITGLDPAGPFFEGTHVDVRLDSTDGRSVIVLHTDGPKDYPHIGLGFHKPCGDIDFYPNGGSMMPGCAKVKINTTNVNDLFGVLYEKIVCSHQMSTKFYSASILRSDGFIGYAALTYGTFKQGSGTPCTDVSCAPMGFKSHEYLLAHGQDPTRSKIFYLNTGNPPNFAAWRFHVSIKFTSPLLVMKSFSVSLCGIDGCSSKYEMKSGILQFDSMFSQFIDVDTYVHPVQEVQFSWHEGLTKL